MLPLSFLSDPHRGAKEGTSAAAIERGCHKDFEVTVSAPGLSLQDGGGEPQSVIGSKRRRLKCLRLAVI